MFFVFIGGKYGYNYFNQAKFFNKIIGLIPLSK